MKNDDILFLQASKQPKLLHHLAVGRMVAAVMGQTRLSTTMNRRPRGNKQVGLNSKKKVTI